MRNKWETVKWETHFIEEEEKKWRNSIYAAYNKMYAKKSGAGIFIAEWLKYIAIELEMMIFWTHNIPYIRRNRIRTTE